MTRLGFGGARGGGKSGAGRRLMLLRRSEYQNTTGLILRRTYPELYRSHIVKLFEEFPEIRQWYRQESKELRLPNGSRLFFGSAEHPGDMSAYYSAEFADIMVDEAQEFSQSELEQLSGSNRSTSNSRIVPATLYTFMPGISEAGLPPKGLNYLRRVLVDGELRGTESRHKWAFVQAFAWDNVEWARKALEADGVDEEAFYAWTNEQRRDYFVERTDFGATLSAITSPGLRDAWLHGLWNRFSGQYFDNFDYDKHTIDAEAIDLPKWTRWWLSDDWGDYHPNVLYLHGMDHTGRVITVAEHWERQMSESAIAAKAVEMCAGRHPETFVMSWDAFGRLSKRTKQPITKLIGDALPDDFPRPFPADASPGSRISGWRFMRKMLDEGRWLISRECTRLIECLPNLVRDMERNPEDVLKVDWSETNLGDDPADSARYGLQYVSGFTPQVPKAPPPVESGKFEAFKLKEKIAGMDKREDPSVAVTISNVPKRRRPGGLYR